MGIRVSASFHHRRAAQIIHAEVLMGVGRRAHGINRDAHAAVGTVLETDRHIQPADQLAVDLRLTGAGTNRRPTQQVIHITGHQRLQQLIGQRQTQPDHLQHQTPGQLQPGSHIPAAIQLRVVHQPLPADRGAGLLDVGTHHQQQLIIDPGCQLGQTPGVVQRRIGIMNRAGTHHHQQARIITMENIANGLALGLNLLGQQVAQGQTLTQYRRSRQRSGTALAVRN